jgi:hypothetical protein
MQQFVVPHPSTKARRNVILNLVQDLSETPVGFPSAKLLHIALAWCGISGSILSSSLHFYKLL